MCPTGEPRASWHECLGAYDYPIDSDWAGDRYIGEFVHGAFHGTGTYFFAGGDEYTGDFVEGKFSGQGVYSFGRNSDWVGDEYIGAFKDSLRHGWGRYKYVSGDEYVGDFVANKFEGTGTFRFANGDEFVGIFEGGIGTSGTATAFGGKSGAASLQLRESKWTIIWANNIQVNSGDAPDDRTTNLGEDLIQASSGSAFAVSTEGHVVTNNHVIDGCGQIELNINGQAIPVRTVTYDKRNDLALLKGEFKPEHVFPIRAKNPGLLEDVYLAGFPFGESYNTTIKVTKGIISSLTGVDNNFSNVQIDAALQPGNSGGPILDEKGNVIAVAVAKLDLQYALDNLGVIPENTNFGIKSSVVLDVLASQGIQAATEVDQQDDKQQLGLQISQGTYYVSCFMTAADIQKMKRTKVLFKRAKLRSSATEQEKTRRELSGPEFGIHGN